MTDKELLEFAAKAILTTEHYENKDYMRGWFSNWNPLTDDGDALRLAMKLGIDVLSSQGFAIAYQDNGEESLFCFFDVDNQSAARRAIVRAAAEIGKTL